MKRFYTLGLKIILLVSFVLLPGIVSHAEAAAVSSSAIPTTTLSSLLNTTEARIEYRVFTPQEREEFRRLTGEVLGDEPVGYYAGFYQSGTGSKGFFNGGGSGGSGRTSFQGYAFRFQEGGVDITISSLPDSIRQVLIATPQSNSIPGLKDFLGQFHGKSLEDSFEFAKTVEDLTTFPVKLKGIAGRRELTETIARQVKRALALSRLLGWNPYSY